MTDNNNNPPSVISLVQKTSSHSPDFRKADVFYDSSSQQPLLDINRVEHVSSIELIKIIWHFGFTLPGDSYVNIIKLHGIFVQQYNLITNAEFETLSILAQKSPGSRTIKFLFVLCYYKFGLAMGLLAVLMFTLPSSIIMYVLSMYPDLSRDLIPGIVFAGFRGACASILVSSIELTQEGKFEMILILFSGLISIIFDSNYIFFLLYGISAVLSLYSRISSKSLHVLPLKFPYNLGLPSLILVCLLLSVFWLGNRFIQNSYLYLCEMLSAIVISTTNKSNSFFSLFYGQLEFFNEKSNLGLSTQQVHQHLINMMGVAIVLPGPLAKSGVFICALFFGLVGGIVGYLLTVGLSIASILVFTTYGQQLIKSEIYRKVHSSVNCVNKGLILYLAWEIFENQKCQFEMIVLIFVVIFVLLKIYQLHKHVAVLVGGALALSRKFFLWKYRSIPWDHFYCIPN